MSIAPAEIAVLLVVGLLAAGVIVVVFVVVAAARRPEARPAVTPAFPGTAPPISADLRDRVRALCAQNQKIHAIKLIRQETGLGLKESKYLAEALHAGRIPPGLQPGTAQRPDLASRVRELKAAGRTEQAIFLVRGETGMNQTEAEAFINTL